MMRALVGGGLWRVPWSVWEGFLEEVTWEQQLWGWEWGAACVCVGGDGQDFPGGGKWPTGSQNGAGVCGPRTNWELLGGQG